MNTWTAKNQIRFNTLNRKRYSEWRKILKINPMKNNKLRLSARFRAVELVTVTFATEICLTNIGFLMAKDAAEVYLMNISVSSRRTVPR